MLEPKEISVKTQTGDQREYIISKFPAIAGREIVCQYPVSGLPKIGEYSANQEIMTKLMMFVSVHTEGGTVALTTKALIDNHVPDWETLSKIEIAMMEYNCSFFQNGKISNFFDTIKATAQQLISSTLIDSLQELLQTAKQASKNSEKTTH